MSNEPEDGWKDACKTKDELIAELRQQIFRLTGDLTQEKNERSNEVRKLRAEMSAERDKRIHAEHLLKEAREKNRKLKESCK